MDPLRDSSFEHIRNIADWTYFTVTDAEKFNAPLIAHNMYDSPDMWWVILVYNGIPDAFSLTPGTRLKIPNQNAVISALSVEQEKAPINSVREL
tara:strand:- start:34397 stop:34678 length:282 start_codon:yes stop_codon:yes gene_type:complete